LISIDDTVYEGVATSVAGSLH
jgi:hypothetical protein